MKPKINDQAPPLRSYAWAVLTTGLILLVPLIAMQFSNEVNWDMRDFVAMGVLLLFAGSLFVRATHRSTRRRRMVTAMMIGGALICIWAELAVGVFTHWLS